MNAKSTEALLKGVIYFRDALTIEGTETVEFDATLDKNSQLLLFQFEHCNFGFDIKNLHLCTHAYHNVEYRDNYDGEDCTLTFFYIQEMALCEDSIFFISGVFDIGEGLNYRIFRMHGYFSDKQQEISAKSSFWFN